MLHGFDLTGIAYDADGEPREWFTPESRLRLEARLDCVARQYAATFWKKVSFMGANIEVQVSEHVIPFRLLFTQLLSLISLSLFLPVRGF